MIPLFNVNQVRAADSYAINKLGIPGQILMENAAISITNAILQKYPYIDNSYVFGILCGKGNNGGDGFALARHLIIRGFTVNILSLGSEKEMKGDALCNYKILKNLIKHYPHSSLVRFRSMRDLQKIVNSEIIVDALLGTGGTGLLNEPYKQLVQKSNEAQAIRIAIDAPTGLNLNNANGINIFNADFTVTLAALKTGLFYEEGRSHSGKVVKGSIGMGESYFDSIQVNDYLIEPEDALTFLPKKAKNIHKYSAGKVLVVGGSDSLPGAAVFAMNAAMMSGTGAGLLAFPESIKKLAQSQMNSAVVIEYQDDGEGFLRSNNIDELNNDISWADCVAVGPGLGRNKETIGAILSIIQQNPDKNMVIDADAIYALSNNKYRKLDLTNKVLTPHHQEFANLIGIDINILKQDLFGYARKFTKQTGSFLVLKGAPTVICNPEGEIFINSSGNSGLAKFGSGDVLSGIIASFIAQQEDIETSAVAAVYLHGLSADLILKDESEFGITPEKLINQFPNTIKFLRKSVV